MQKNAKRGKKRHARLRMSFFFSNFASKIVIYDS